MYVYEYMKILCSAGAHLYFIARQSRDRRTTSIDRLAIFACYCLLLKCRTAVEML